MTERDHRDTASAAQDGAGDHQVTAISRRTALAGAAATAALSFGVGAMAETPPAAADANLDAFLNLSAALTGIAKKMLAPDTDSLGMGKAYFDFVDGKKLSDFATLLQVTKDAHLQIPPPPGGIIAQPDVDRLAKAIADKGDAPKYLARSILLMWYLGAWYEPSVLKALAKDPKAIVSYTVVSPKAYTQGWLWRVAQAHPMGYSDMQFGYWTRKPEEISDFIEFRIKGKGA
jgi:hypothetical protein